MAYRYDEQTRVEMEAALSEYTQTTIVFTDASWQNVLTRWENAEIQDGEALLISAFDELGLDASEFIEG